MKRVGLLLAASVAIAAVPAAAESEPLVQTVESHRNDIGEIDKGESGFVHRASGFAYPSMIGEMPARKTVTYGPMDAAVYYTLYGGGNGDPWIDLYVYPAALDPGAEAADVEKWLVGNFNAKPIDSPAGLPAKPADAVERWLSGSREGVQYLTGYRLIRNGDWYVKARISIPATGGQPAIDCAMKAIGAIPWTGQTLRPAPAPSLPATATTGA